MNSDKNSVAKIKIFNAFKELLLKKDFCKIKVNEIVLVAGVNRSTFYFHFKDKYDLLQEHIKHELLSYYKENVGDNHDAEKIIIKFLNSVQESKKAIRVLCDHCDESKVVETFENFAQTLYSKILVNENLSQEYNAFVVSKYLAVGTVGCIKWWLFNENQITPEELGKQIWQFYIDVSNRETGRLVN